MSSTHITRRNFLKSSSAGLALAPFIGASFASAADKPIPTRPLGSTGVNVSILGLGGYHIGTLRDDNRAVSFIRKAIDMGVTFLDNAWEYHGGRSEELMGRALQNGYREKTFLMTKHHGRDKKTAMKHLEDSLRRLKTDVIDLWQYHEVVYPDDPEMIYAPGGGIEAADLAKKQGKVRFIGFTGHRDPLLHLKMLAYGYPFDAVQMPLNVFDHHHKSFEQHVLPILVRRNIGVVAMKTLASGHVLKSGLVTADQGLDYVWSLPVSTIVSGLDSDEVLRENVNSAKTFKPISQRTRKQLLDKTREAAKDAKYEPFKIPHNYDGPVGRKLHDIE